MKIELAKNAGFCFGVDRAVNAVCEELAKKNGPVYTYGPIIHNEEVIRDFEERGVRIIDSAKDARLLPGGTVVIRSHGVTEAEERELLASGLTVVDATCPFVKRIHSLVQEYSEKGYTIIVIGSPDHPEVRGIVGWSRSERTFVVSNREDVTKIPLEKGENVCIVSQTTFNFNNFQELVEILKKKMYDKRNDSGGASSDTILREKRGGEFIARNTICNATQERQEAAGELARRADAMFVIGGKSSSNSRRLYEICAENCKNTYFIQTKEDLEDSEFPRFGYVGITAGASTPKKIIEEVRNRMSELSFEQMLEGSVKTIRNGEVVEGTVLHVKPEEIVLNIGYKSDGIIPRSEYTNESGVDLTTVVSVGDTMEAKVLKVNDGEGQVALTYKRLAAERGSERLREAFENGEVLKAPVTQVLDGGLSVMIDDTRIFIPASLVSDVYERDLGKFKDQEIEFILTEFNPRRRRIIGDRKQLLIAEKERRQRELLERIHVGDIIEGSVKNITDFGAFIDLGGADGLLHISEMSWGRVDNPKKIYKVGQVVRVFIKDIRGTKIALSVKFPEENPWNNAAEKYAAGTIVTGTVARMTDFGAFVELTPGVDALLHVSQISREHVDKPSDVLSIGQVIEAQIVDFNEAERKISLSMKALLKNASAKAAAAEEVSEEPAEETADAVEEAAVETAVESVPAEAETAAAAEETAEAAEPEAPAEAPAEE